jgi:hypothetical protein
MLLLMTLLRSGNAAAHAKDRMMSTMNASYQKRLKAAYASACSNVKLHVAALYHVCYRRNADCDCRIGR